MLVTGVLCLETVIFLFLLLHDLMPFLAEVQVIQRLTQHGKLDWKYCLWVKLQLVVYISEESGWLFIELWDYGPYSKKIALSFTRQQEKQPIILSNSQLPLSLLLLNCNRSLLLPRSICWSDLLTSLAIIVIFTSKVQIAKPFIHYSCNLLHILCFVGGNQRQVHYYTFFKFCF